MTPQSEFLVLAPVRPEALKALRALLAKMNAKPGQADPVNRLVPFGAFPTLHVARFVVLEDETLVDNAAFGMKPFDAPVYLAFLGDCDGPASDLLDEVACKAGASLARVFSHCKDFPADADVRAWMQKRLVSSQAYYVNWVGRTVLQVKEEAALHAALATELARVRAEGQTNPGELQTSLRAAVAANGPKLSSPAPTPLPWFLGHIADLLFGILILALAVPILLIASPLLLWILRRHETRDPELTVPIDPVRANIISAMEDHDVTNPFSAIGTIKPGAFRLALVRGSLWLLNFGAAQIYKRGRLARVGTIHFARWVIVDKGRRVIFISNYDGSLESYMDDFVNKAAFGLNLVFSNGVGYPTTNWLLLDGAQDEQRFKAFLRRRQRPTDVWYRAYPGLTAFDLARNSEIRQGLENDTMSDDDLRRWLAKI
ncbi:hypothetical protein [Phenylobacterium sp.]|uniref:hypothetical protein n=1 Tax=Phenylobacterium sp. TaxID=1871053 RepID=UPI00356698FD